MSLFLDFFDTDLFFIIFVLIVLPIIIYFGWRSSMKFIKKNQGKYCFRCSKCGFQFNPNIGYFFSSESALAEFSMKFPSFIKCPKCKKYSWCSVISK